MSKVRRFKISGELKNIVNEVYKDRLRFYAEVKELANKYKFKEFITDSLEFNSGAKLKGFASPEKDCKLEMFRKPNKNGIYLPKVKEGKQIIKDIDNLIPWKLEKIWEYLKTKPHPFIGTCGIYTESKLNDELMFYSYKSKEEFKGHKNLQELKLSEYYEMIGE